MKPKALAQKSLRVFASELTRLNSLPAVRCCRSEGARTRTCVGVVARHQQQGEHNSGSCHTPSVLGWEKHEMYARKADSSG
jgi:hypothetical protein